MGTAAMDNKWGCHGYPQEEREVRERCGKDLRLVREKAGLSLKRVADGMSDDLGTYVYFSLVARMERGGSLCLARVMSFIRVCEQARKG